MHSDLDIFAGALVRRLTPIKYPPFPPAAKTLAALASLRYIRRGASTRPRFANVYSGGLHGEER